MTPAPDLASVKAPDAPVRESVTTLPAAPRTVNAPTVVVTFGKTMVCATILVLAISENVGVPEIVVVDVLVFPPIVNFPNVFVPAANVLAVVVLFDKVIPADPETVADVVTQQVPEPVTVHEALPRFTTVPVAVERLPIETVYVPASMSAPSASVNAPVQVKLSPRLR